MGARVDDQSVGAVPIPKPTVTGDRDRPLSSDSESPGDTEISGPAFGVFSPCYGRTVAEGYRN